MKKHLEIIVILPYKIRTAVQNKGSRWNERNRFVSKSDWREANMTSKELLYVEDALGHEQYFQTQCHNAASQI